MSALTSTVSLAEFASALFSSGLAVVSRGKVPEAEDAGLQQMLAGAFQSTLQELPGKLHSTLHYVPATGLSGMSYLYRLCLALADRSLTDEEVQGVCDAAPPPPATADEILSVDLALRHLPEIYRLARSISETDPMITALERIATAFPLSSVGIPPHLPPDLTLLQRHPVLWGLYLDRILDRQDESRLLNEAVRHGVRDALGLHSSLAPKLAAKLALLV